MRVKNGCECQGMSTAKRRSAWRVVQRNCNYSAFNGYRRTPSSYSLIRCMCCGRAWRTKANYVTSLPDDPDMNEVNA